MCYQDFVFTTWKNIKKSYRDNKSGTTWDEEFQLPDGGYSISERFEYIIKKYENPADKPLV